MITNSKRTVYGNDLALHKMLGKKYKLLPNTTLNEKFSLLYNEKIPDYRDLNIGYYAIGVGGIKTVNNDGTYTYVQHLPTDASLYEQIPFVMRKVNDDILDNEKSKYRFRIKEVWNNEEYYCYYLKVIDYDNVINNIFNITKLKDKFTLSKFSSDSSKYLNPDPNYESNVDSAIDADYITNVAKLKFSLDKNELIEIDNVKNIRYGNTDKPISEIAVCSGMDKEIPEAGITEAIGVQVCYFANIDLKTTLLENINHEVIRAIEIGGLEPLKV